MVSVSPGRNGVGRLPVLGRQALALEQHRRYYTERINRQLDPVTQGELPDKYQYAGRQYQVGNIRRYPRRVVIMYREHINSIAQNGIFSHFVLGVLLAHVSKTHLLRVSRR